MTPDIIKEHFYKKINRLKKFFKYSLYLLQELYHILHYPGHKCLHKIFRYKLQTWNPFYYHLDLPLFFIHTFLPPLIIKQI